MSKINKSSKSANSPKNQMSRAIPPQTPAKEPQKLELVKVISPAPKSTEDQTQDQSKSVVTPETPKDKGLAKVLEVSSKEQLKEQLLEPTNLAELEEGDGSSAEKLQPIPPATESMQYRAIGVVQGHYIPTEDQFSKGQIISPDGTTVDAVLLGKVISIVKKRLDLAKDYLWVVYPRTRDKDGELHVQIAGVWAPVEMGKSEHPIDPGVEDGYFSVRGEVIRQSLEENSVLVKVKRADQKLDKARSKFKLRLSGILPDNAVGHFWNINVQRQGNELNILDGEAIAPIARKPPRKPTRSPYKGGNKPQFNSAKPVKRTSQAGSDSVTGVQTKPSRPRPTTEKPSRPVKRPKDE